MKVLCDSNSGGCRSLCSRRPHYMGSKFKNPSKLSKSSYLMQPLRIVYQAKLSTVLTELEALDGFLLTMYTRSRVQKWLICA